MLHDDLADPRTATAPLADRLLRALTDPDVRIEVPYDELPRLSDEELGILLAEAHAVPSSAPLETRRLALDIRGASRDRRPRYTPDACRRMIEALAARSEDEGWVNLTPGLQALEHCTGPLPDVTGPLRTLVQALLAKDSVHQLYALIAIAGLVDEGLLREVVERLSRDMGPIVADEIAVVAGLPTAEQTRLSEAFREHRHLSAPSDADAWHRSAENPAYAAFARRALEAAADRAAAIRAGEIPYRADKAFTDREITTLGQAARVALHRDEPWLPDLFDRLLPGISLAPTTARTLPSQGLLYELVRAAQDFPTPEAVTAIRAVRGTVRHAGVPKQLDKMLKKLDAALAERTDVALRLPTWGFDTDGVLRREVDGGYAAVVTVAETATLVWEKDGRPLRSVPAPVRRDHAGLVKELRDLVKRVNAQLLTLVRALEGGLTVDAVHPYGWWRTGLAGHPLARTLVGRLIWEVEIAPGTWRAVLPETDELPAAPDEAAVRLWHPIRSRPDDVRAWRDLLVEGRIRQPFKQAFREIYLLTPAEEETRVYSNRFAAHLVHYRRMFALFRARGWASDLLGPWDGGEQDAAERTLGAGQWRIRFFHALADWEGEASLAATDQVRFARRVDGDWREVPLTEVPPLVFSEAMRDVDLFVGVTSIAADPDWTDGGPTRAYWERAGFAELPESAEARRDVLERILPRLKIADRCTLDGRFLVVRGALRTYRIHLGSANILMEPDDSYLCIVAARGKSDGTVFLPFEDERLSLILSKAFLLADDTKITDESILGQIARG
ncbi:hypothetical protein SLINC_7230 [Streptomyces lincolnensis]|uniref:Uncharacterized protein n=1 Tax=Streptomyces lincolnensis TaxID=1915 RepID=A0A1B1MLL5_STRLN|nr:DUF4132 domain-containing protein [Streptomyces lincolnensis]ANS69454.1 hypothetical protein SLINC_7230 [Streptomyces lincolnensis]AXG58373.1 hypothetical protein SLCG_7218 [Streptomyces lincolnensis]QMV11026.1 DUF4132 domain-containing protein [Streptomyces lincolnensis]